MQKNLRLHIILFFLTLATLTFRESLLFALVTFNFSILVPVFQAEWPYSFALIFILLCHEMGHYLPARYYGINATLPFFIPFPVSPIGTMGAVIKIRDLIPDKQKLFDIGAGGPLASLVLSAIAWVWGIYLSETVSIATFSHNPENVLHFGDSIFTYWTAQWIKGPFDTAEVDILLHPLAKAGWVGLLITAINLLPFGQLDGGHVIYSLFGENYRKWIYFLFLGFLSITLVSPTWLLWGFILYFIIKIEHPFVPDYTYPLSNNRKALGYFLLVSFFFIFIPDPLHIGSDNNTLLADIWNFLKNWF